MQDFLPVFAAGNEGGVVDGSRGITTVTSPATAKNCVSAGATMTAYEDAQSVPHGYSVFRMSVSQPSMSGPQEVENYRVRAHKACSYCMLETLAGKKEGPAVTGRAGAIIVLAGSCRWQVVALWVLCHAPDLRQQVPAHAVATNQLNVTGFWHIWASAGSSRLA